MNLTLAVVIGVMFGGGLYMMLKRSLVRILIGLLLIGNSINLLIFTVGRLVPGRPPIISLDAESLAGIYADPLPQALILTAIVISFGVTAFAVVLIKQTYAVLGTDDLNQLRCTDLPCPRELEEERK